LRLLLQTAPETTIAINEDKPPPPNTALYVLCDYNKLLLFDALKDDAIVSWVQDNLRSGSSDSKVFGNMHLEVGRAHDSPNCPFGKLTYTCTDFVYKDHASVMHHIYIRVHDQVKFCCDTESSEPAKFLSHAKPGPYNTLEIMSKPQNSTAPPKTILTMQLRRGAMSTVGSKRKRPNILIEP
jgi:hypothetical protein